MKVYQIPNYQYNNYYVQKQVPHFTSIKSTTPDGLYRKQDGEAQKITDALQENPYAIEFFKKHDVHLGYHAVKTGTSLYSSSLHIRYNVPARNRIKASFGIKDQKEIVINASETTLEKCTDKLVEYILPGSKKNGNGNLSSRIRTAEKEFQDILNEIEAKKQAKQAKKQAKIDKKQQQKDDKQAAEKSIKNLEEKINQ